MISIVGNNARIRIFFGHAETRMADDDTTRTTARTLWTETILEILYDSLSRNKDDGTIRGVLREVLDKGYKPAYIIEKVRGKVDESAAARVRKLLQMK